MISFLTNQITRIQWKVSEFFFRWLTWFPTSLPFVECQEADKIWAPNWCTRSAWKNWRVCPAAAATLEMDCSIVQHFIVLKNDDIQPNNLVGKKKSHEEPYKIPIIILQEKIPTLCPFFGVASFGVRRGSRSVVLRGHTQGGPLVPKQFWMKL